MFTEVLKYNFQVLYFSISITCYFILLPGYNTEGNNELFT